MIRDPIHNIIPFDDTRCDRLLLRLIDTREFQRLRRVRQLGMAQLVYPGADHTRFSHSIGVMQIARRILDRLEKLFPHQITEPRRIVVLAAALLHDVGHGPFSHTFEQITSEHHEDRTLQILTREETEVNRVLRRFDTQLPETLSAFFNESLEGDGLTRADLPPFLTQIVSSQLDADRFDYLLRDSHATGVGYGQFDINWLIQHLLVDDESGRFCLNHKALVAAETYVFARHHMHLAVYFHKASRAAELMMRLLFRRCARLASQSQRDFLEEAPGYMQKAFGEAPMTLDEYLQLDDHAMTEFLKACDRSNDFWISRLAGGILHRRLYKSIDATDAAPEQIERFEELAKARVAEQGFDAEFALERDSPGDLPYRPYDPDADHSSTQIYIQTRGGGKRELSQVSDAIGQLKQEYTLLRYYYPSELRKPLDAIGKRTLFT